MADQAVRMIEDFAADARPWHIRLDYSQPHLPCVPAEPFASMYAPEDIPRWGNFPDELSGKPYIQRKQLESWNLSHWAWEEWSQYLSGYYGIISQYDDAYGRILETLDRLGLFENTIIVYTTDHGDAAGSHGMMDKHYVMYEEEVRVPLVVRWDGVIEAGTTSDAFVANYLDLGPTLLDVAGIDIPDSFQGVSLLPELRGEAGPAGERDLIFSEYNGQQFGLYTQRMVRDRRYKYVWNPTDVDELYDLEQDPWEMENLAGARSDLHRHYQRRLFETFTALGDKMVNGLWTRYQLTGETRR
jgi:arylsulfatase A-like enzyme